MNDATKQSLLMILVAVLLMGLCFVIAALAGCGRSPQVKTPHSIPATRIGEWVVRNIERVNGPSLTGVAWARHRMDIKMSKEVVMPPEADTSPCGTYTVHVQHTGTRRVKVGLVQIREAETWAEFNAYERQLAVIGIGLEVRF